MDQTNHEFLITHNDGTQLKVMGHQLRWGDGYISLYDVQEHCVAYMNTNNIQSVVQNAVQLVNINRKNKT